MIPLLDAFELKSDEYMNRMQGITRNTVIATDDHTRDNAIMNNTPIDYTPTYTSKIEDAVSKNNTTTQNDTSISAEIQSTT